MANNESQKQQLIAQMGRAQNIIKALEDTLDENPNDHSSREELRRQKQILQGLRDESNS